MTETTKLLKRMAHEIGMTAHDLDMVDIPGESERKRQVIYHLESAKENLERIKA